jgi:vacuolar-type H+-ATPase subunit F/Vma7
VLHQSRCQTTTNLKKTFLAYPFWLCEMDIAIVGDKYLATVFRLIGIETVEAENENAAATKVEQLVEKGGCKVLFLSERVALRLKELRERFLKERRFYPVFVIIPDFEGSVGERKRELQEFVNTSMGVKLKVGA